MITDAEVEKALDYLRDSAEPCAKWRSEKVYLTEFRKVKKAELMKASNAQHANEREQHAYAHPEYLEILGALKTAVFNEARDGFLRDAAEAKIEAWRTQQSNQRAMGRVV